jgi:hypothetical protein
MQVDRAIELAKKHSMKLSADVDNMFNLYDIDGNYIDTLYLAQIRELQEDDFIDFYLDEIDEGDYFDSFFDMHITYEPHDSVTK